MALRPRLSTGLPLSNEQMIRFQQNEPGQQPGSRRYSEALIFGSLAILVPLVLDAFSGARGGAVDPWLCVPVFRRVCGFGYCQFIITTGAEFTPFVSVIPVYRIETPAYFTGTAITKRRPQLGFPAASMQV
jgi:hypothetical protein